MSNSLDIMKMKINIYNFIVCCLFIIPLVSCIEINLNEGWTIRNKNGSIKIENQRLPSGVYSALHEANLTESVLHSYNDVNLRWISKEEWTYSLTLNVSYDDSNPFVILVFHGIDTHAKITLNGINLEEPFPDNMFLRYRYDVAHILLKDQENRLDVEFASPMVKALQYANNTNFTPPDCPPEPYNGECHMNMLRKMQASFAWDWGLAAPSVGLWQSVIIESYRTAIIRDITYKLEEEESNWIIETMVYLESGTGSSTAGRRIRGFLSVSLDGVLHRPTKKYVSAEVDENGEISVSHTIKIRKNGVKLWWPNGYGNQKLYQLKATWIGLMANMDTNEIEKQELKFLRSKKSVRVGFRTIDLVELPLDLGLTFYFKVNGVPIFMKGSNWIPSNILPEKSFDQDRVRYLLTAAKKSHMNMIRVWGGGIYETDYFYDLADEYGILIWQDMMYACAMYPVFTDFLNSVRLEMRQQVRRLQSHPSIALWAGNNENEAALVQNWYGTAQEFDRFSREYILLYGGVIKDEILKNDQWHPYLYSSPSNGLLKSQQEIIQSDPQNWHYGDIHHYDYFANGWDSNVFPKSRFVSEYGFQSFPSLNSWNTIRGKNDSLTELITHRQHFPMGNFPIMYLVEMHFPPLPPVDSENYWSTLIYYSQINQAMILKTETEVFRAERDGLMKTMGALYWQLNDVWVAPSWSSIDFTGNFKLFHYYIKNVFAPRTVIAKIHYEYIYLYATRDTLGDPEEMVVTLSVRKLSSFEPGVKMSWNITMKENSSKKIGSAKLTDLFKPPLYRNNSIIWIEMIDTCRKRITTTFQFAEKLKDMSDIQNANIKMNISSTECINGEEHTIMTINVEHPAYFVYITVDKIQKYELSDNGFMQLEPSKNVSLTFSNPNCELDIAEEDITIMAMNQFMRS